MSSIRDWMARRSGVELFLIYGIFFGVILGLVMSGAGNPPSLIADVIGGALFGATVSALTLRARRQSGGQGRDVQLNTAIQSGELPELIDPTTWLTDLDKRLVNLRRSRVTIPVAFGILVVSEVLIGLNGPRPNYAFLALAAAVALLAVASIVSTRRRIPKIEALELKIREAYDLPGPTSAETAS
jgi:hypothetical protein